MRTRAVLLVGVALLLAGCAEPPLDFSDGAVPVASVPADAPLPAATVVLSAPGPATAAPTDADPQHAVTQVPTVPHGVVPDVTGFDLRLARQTMQAAGYDNVVVEDATGQSRSVLVDRNWVVVEQVPTAGTIRPGDTSVTLRSTSIRN